MVSALSTPPALPDLDRSWSRRITAPDGSGGTDTFHVLDTGGSDEAGTLVCVHGNPTWSYLWRGVLASAPDGWRVIAVDHLGMGYSSRPARMRRLDERIEDLTTVLDALGVDTPVSLAVHDWGGPIGLGWAGRHADRVRSLAITNTAVHQDPGASVPAAIRLARSASLLRAVCRTTPAFVRAATEASRLAGRPLDGAVRAAFAAPYPDARSRQSVLDFVADIPLEPTHPSRQALDHVVERLERLRDKPALLLWGSQDPVFTDHYLQDLIDRLPQARVQRYPDASHLVLEDRPDAVAALWTFLLSESTATPASTALSPEPSDSTSVPDVAPALPDRLQVDPQAEGLAVVELGSDHGRRLTFADLRDRIDAAARRLSAAGVRAGDRVSVLVPPGSDLTVVAYALWSLGAVVVVADAGLGLRPLGRALRSARPRFVIGIPQGLAAVTALRVPGRRLRISTLMREVERDVRAGLPEAADPAPVPLDADAAILFTSGATGPPKGVVYTGRRLLAMIDLLRRSFGIGSDDAFVAAFAPFALYGPALGIPSAVPQHALEPHRLTAHDLAAAVEAIGATMVFASPRALSAVVESADAATARDRQSLAGPRLLLSAGAPVPVPLLRQVKALLSGAETQTPYGMTEALPVASADPLRLLEDGLERQDGVCVGPPLPGVDVRLTALRADGTVGDDLGDETGTLGEIVVRAAHVKERYDRLWVTEHRSSLPGGWHRTGDVGHLDDAGFLWVEGRLVHVLTTVDGPLAPVGVEQRVEDLDAVGNAAVVGVGPAGIQQVVVVVTLREPTRAAARRILASPGLTAQVRAVAGVPVSAVLVRAELPVDIRHRSKIDRTALAAWAGTVLDGRSR